jgi:hypothetical protein
MTHLTRVGPSLVTVAVLTGACGRSEESRQTGAETGATDSAAVMASTTGAAVRRVSNVMIGRQVGPNDRITEPTFQFTPKDTVQISVATEGAGGGGTLSAAWRSQNGEILQQTSAPIPAAGENVAFHLSRREGLKPGTYKVIIFLGEDSVETKVFVVKK